MAGTKKPDYARVIDITTRGALWNMVIPGVLAVAFPIFIGVTMKYEALGGFLLVGTITGILLALILNNGGGAWDNAKKYIESGAHGGKGSEAHKAAVIGDTLGDPFKDTAGPSLHVLIKLLGDTLARARAAVYLKIPLSFFTAGFPVVIPRKSCCIRAAGIGVPHKPVKIFPFPGPDGPA